MYVPSSFDLLGVACGRYDQLAQIGRGLPCAPRKAFEMSRSLQAVGRSQDSLDAPPRHREERLELLRSRPRGAFDLVERSGSYAGRPSKLVRDSFEERRAKVGLR